MKTKAYKPTPRIICDCCPEMATAKGGDAPHYLCDAHKALPVRDVVRLMRVKYGMPAEAEA
jgi:hypothetical protein